MGFVTSCGRITFAVVVVLFLVQLVRSAPRPVDDNCRRHRKFRECSCHQYAVILGEDEGLEYADAGLTVHDRTDISPDSKKPYYYCIECQKCGDGVLVERKCTQKSDTVCSDDKCTDETWIFNFGLKACLPPPPPPPTTTPPSTVESKVTRTDTANLEDTGSSVPDKNPKVGTSQWLQNNNQVIILALVGGVAFLVVVIILMMAVVCQMRHQHHQAGHLLTSSSQNTSTQSIPTRV